MILALVECKCSCSLWPLEGRNIHALVVVPYCNHQMAVYTSLYSERLYQTVKYTVMSFFCVIII